MAAANRCKDCKAEGITTFRKMYINPRTGEEVPGPRCKSHWFKVKGKRRDAAHGRRLETIYGISRTQYLAIKAAQGGRCYMCRWARGLKKELAVDHDHNKGCDHPSDRACPECVRGLLCSECNQMFGRARDDVGFFLRGIEYLTNPPAQVVLLGMDE